MGQERLHGVPTTASVFYSQFDRECTCGRETAKMNRDLRVGIVVHRFECLGGIQTCFIELVAGLNEIGIVPEIVWDEPQNWEALGNPNVEATFGDARLGLSSRTLRRLPTPLAERLRRLSLRFAKLDLHRYDFVFCFEPEARMPESVRNLCWLTGPLHLRLPGDQVEWRRLYRSDQMRLLLRHISAPLLKADKNSRYVTHSDWIADLFLHRFGFRPPVIWPPARERTLPQHPGGRAGFLFLSRIVEYKCAHSMLTLARAFPRERVTIAGAVVGNDPYVDNMRRRIRDEQITNVRIVENPSEAEVATLLTMHELFVFPAPWEHFGIVTVEAIQAGLIPLVHNTGGQREIVPFDFLRFLNDEDLIKRAQDIQTMTSDAKTELIHSLQRHALRGSAEHYRAEMLREVKDMQWRRLSRGALSIHPLDTTP